MFTQRKPSFGGKKFGAAAGKKPFSRKFSSEGESSRGGSTSTPGARAPQSSGFAPRRSGGFGGGRPSFGGSRGGRPSFGGRGGGGGGRRGGRFMPHLDGFADERQYIHKAVSQETEAYKPTHTFEDFNIHEQLAANIKTAKFHYPTPIQDQAIPVALTGKDVIGIAGTGTGKTVAFLIPIINRFVEDRKHMAMVLAPTRELAQQIEEAFKQLTRGMRLFSVSCVGGAPEGRQLRELEQGVHMVIGTPGRVQDFIQRKKIKLNEFGSVVLDEADRMLDMGFIDDMRDILKGMPEDRRSYFFSATFSPEIRKLCGEFLNNPVTVSVKTRDTASSVDQNVVRYNQHEEKIDLLVDILKQPEANKVLIFRETKRSVDELAETLHRQGFKAEPLHGDLRNRQRERAVRALATGQVQVLIATDVAARGIDIPDVSHVINFDLPQNYDTYIHRIGRTGRGSKLGTALTFVRNRR